MAGLPDRMCLLPGGIIFFAEIKTTGKKLRALQEVFKKQLEGLGFHYYVIDTTDKLLEMLLNENENGGHRNITYNLVSGADNFEDKLLDEYCCTIEYFKKESVECLIQDGLIKYMKGDLILTEHPEENIYALQEIKT